MLAEQLAIPADERAAFLQCARAELGADRLVTPIPPIAQLVPPTPTVRPTLTTQPGLPSGMVTFLFTDIEDSTPSWEREPEQMRLALARHDAILRMAIAKHSGHAYKVIGDSFQAAFAFPAHAVVAALAAQHTLATQTWETSEPVRVRMGVHVGPALAEGNDYTTTHTLNRVARIMAAGHGGQILLSREAADLVRRDLPTDVTLRDMGKHRMKGLTQLEHLFQVAAPDLPSAFPPLKTLDLLRTNLPAQLTSFIGREKAIAEVKQLLNTSRLVTLTGPGGTGKTRLALQAAAEVLQDFAYGAYVVNLASISDAALVVATIAQILGVTERGSRPLLESLKAELHDKDMLLLLDNFEQVLPAGPQLAELLAACPMLKILVTSREVLHLYGEHEFGVPPLALPDRTQLPPLDRLTQYEAVRLFIERAQAAKADFAVTNASSPAVVEICYRLDGLPLAIELAAARVKLFAPQALLSRLEHRLVLLTGGGRDLPVRHQTIRGAIDWSYHLLDAAEQMLFARLGVFAGGCTLEAAAAVCNADSALPSELTEGVASLVDQSLLRLQAGADGEPRVLMLETIREYALELLRAHGEAEVLRRRHAAYFLALAEAAETQRPDVTWAARVARLEAELDNLRAALTWSQATAGDARIGLRLAKELLYVWMRGGYWTEARSWLTRVLAHPQGSERTLLRAQVLTCAGYMCALLDDYAAAQAAFAESLALCEELGDIQERAWVLNRMGMLAREQGDTAQAHARLERSLELYRELGDSDGIIEGLNTLGEVAVIQEEPARATTLLEESLALSRMVGNANGSAWALNHLGHVAQLEQDYGRATQLHMESLALFREFGEQHLGIPSAHQSLGECALARGDLVGAQAWLSAGLEQFRKLGHRAGIARCLAGLGSMIGMSGQPAQAARLWGAADALRQAIGGRPDPAARATYERVVAAVRANLGDEAFAAAWAEGLVLSLEQAIAEVLRADS